MKKRYKKEFLKACQEGSLSYLKSVVEKIVNCIDRKNASVSVGVEHDGYYDYKKKVKEVKVVDFSDTSKEGGALYIIVNLRDNLERTGLHLACRWGHYKVVEYLLLCGSDPIVADKNGQTPLHLACMYFHQQIIQLLIGVGASVYIEDCEGASVQDLLTSRLEHNHKHELCVDNDDGFSSTEEHKQEIRYKHQLDTEKFNEKIRMESLNDNRLRDDVYDYFNSFEDINLHGFGHDDWMDNIRNEYVGKRRRKDIPLTSSIDGSGKRSNTRHRLEFKPNTSGSKPSVDDSNDGVQNPVKVVQNAKIPHRVDYGRLRKNYELNWSYWLTLVDKISNNNKSLEVVNDASPSICNEKLSPPNSNSAIDSNSLKISQSITYMDVPWPDAELERVGVKGNESNPLFATVGRADTDWKLNMERIFLANPCKHDMLSLGLGLGLGSSSEIDKQMLKSRIRIELLRWHPDKFLSKLCNAVSCKNELEKISLKVNAISQCLSDMKSKYK